MQTQEDVLRVISRVTAQAQADPAFKAAYMQNPNEVLAGAGLEIPPNVNFKVQPVNSVSPEFQVSSEDGTVYLVLPEVEEVVQDESLATAAAASCDTTASTAGTVTTCVSSASSKSTNSCS